MINGVEAIGLDAELDLDVSLARGLNYYTGTIIEVKARDVAIGSITGGDGTTTSPAYSECRVYPA